MEPLRRVALLSILFRGGRPLGDATLHPAAPATQRCPSHNNIPAFSSHRFV